MAWTRLVALAGAVLLAGCTLIPRAVYNIEYDHSTRADQSDLFGKHRQLAQTAWLEAWAAQGGGPPEAGLAEGFVDGFADFLDRGGSGVPPAIPPNQFRFGDAHSPSGHEAAARYEEGFALGAQAAQASGRRDESLVPVFAPVGAPQPPGYDAPPLAPRPARPPELPPARPVGPARADPVGRRIIDIVPAREPAGRIDALGPAGP